MCASPTLVEKSFPFEFRQSEYLMKENRAGREGHYKTSTHQGTQYDTRTETYERGYVPEEKKVLNIDPPLHRRRNTFPSPSRRRRRPSRASEASDDGSIADEEDQAILPSHYDRNQQQSQPSLNLDNAQHAETTSFQFPSPSLFTTYDSSVTSSVGPYASLVSPGQQTAHYPSQVGWAAAIASSTSSTNLGGTTAKKRRATVPPRMASHSPDQIEASPPRKQNRQSKSTTSKRPSAPSLSDSLPQPYLHMVVPGLDKILGMAAPQDHPQKDNVDSLSLQGASASSSSVSNTSKGALTQDEEDEELGEGDLEDALNVKEANWFLDVLEGYNLSRLSVEEREKLTRSNLRSKIKHRASIIFFEDVDFILRTDHKLQLDMNNPKCRRDPKKWLVHQICQIIVEKYKYSIQNKADRSCIWSALMERALYHLTESGFSDCSIESGGGNNREATLFVGDYHISRSNFTKVFKRYCKD